MKNYFVVAVLMLLAIGLKAQVGVKPVKPTDTAKLYNPTADAKADIANAEKKGSH